MPPGYLTLNGWWVYGEGKEPTKSVLPKKGAPLLWELGDAKPRDLPQPPRPAGKKTKPSYGDLRLRAGPRTRRVQPSIQGWKLHICIHPDDIEDLFAKVSHYLKNSKISHKFCPFDSYKRAGYGMKAFYIDDSAPGKACVIYPLDPTHLVTIINKLEALIAAARSKGLKGKTLRPYPGGVRGDLLVGNSRLMYIRYGGFWGPLAEKGLLYDPKTKKEVRDPRLKSPFPDFIRGLPAELKALRRAAPAHLL